ncbi:MAG TPA: hypothetical protein PLB87_00210 [Prolixibacteraceae bacterium]|nr:hypothetical protein [Prolixibacteraceae bacterium]
MDNKIILEMVVKDLEEIKFLVESLSLPEKIDPLLIEITATKAKAFYQELMFLSANNPIPVEKEEILIEEQPFISPENNTADEEEIPVEEISSEELSEVETPVAEEFSAPADEIGSAAGKTVSEQDTSEEITEKITEEPIEISEGENIREETTDETVAVEETILENVAAESKPKEEAIVAEEPIPEPENEVSSETASEEVEENTPAEVESEIEQPSDLLIPTEATVETTEAAAFEAGSNTKQAPALDETEEITMEEEPEIQKQEEQPVAEPSIYEKLAATTNPEIKTKGKPVDNIMNAIGINDKFMFSKELFANDAQKFEDTVNHLDSLNTFIEAIDFLEKNFKWTKNDASLKFMDLLKRRFQK